VNEDALGTLPQFFSECGALFYVIYERSTDLNEMKN
jgi:hypothetical protein